MSQAFSRQGEMMYDDVCCIRNADVMQAREQRATEGGVTFLCSKDLFSPLTMPLKALKEHHMSFDFQTVVKHSTDLYRL